MFQMHCFIKSTRIQTQLWPGTKEKMTMTETYLSTNQRILFVYFCDSHEHVSLSL